MLVLWCYWHTLLSLLSSRAPPIGTQMMTILFGEMLQFALVLGTIMMGFTVSFFALFQDTKSYGDVSLAPP